MTEESVEIEWKEPEPLRPGCFTTCVQPEIQGRHTIASPLGASKSPPRWRALDGSDPCEFRSPSRELPAMLRGTGALGTSSDTLRATYLRFMEERRRGEHRPASCVDTRNRVFRGFVLCARESAYPDVNPEAMRRG